MSTRRFKGAEAPFTVKPRFVPAQVIASWVPLLKSYRITEIEGDKFAGGFHSSK
jgi:hypothetical protein